MSTGALRTPAREVISPGESAHPRPRQAPPAAWRGLRRRSPGAGSGRSGSATRLAAAFPGSESIAARLVLPFGFEVEVLEIVAEVDGGRGGLHSDPLDLAIGLELKGYERSEERRVGNRWSGPTER